MPTAVSLGVALTMGQSAAAAVATLAAPTMAQMTTAVQTKELDADGITWPAANPLVVDEFGKLIVFVQYFRQADGTKYHVPIVSNDNGATWVLPTLSGFFNNTNGDVALVRGAYCYDATTHLMHACWVLLQTDGGVYYRQYSFARDGSNNITGVTRTRQQQLEKGVAGMAFEFPVALMAGTKLVVAWAAWNNAAPSVKAAVRAMALVPDGTDHDRTPASWTAPLWENSGAGATEPLNAPVQTEDAVGAGVGSPVAMKCSILAQSTTSAQATVAAAVLANGNLAFATCLGGNATGTFRFNQAVWSGANSDWRTGLATALSSDSGQVTLSAVNRSGSGGDTLKSQRLSKLAQASATSLLVTFAAWNGAVDGDVVYAALVNPSAGTLTSLTQVYVVGGAHSYAATTDCAWDATAGRYVVTYIKTTTKNAFFVTYTQAMGAGQGETALHAIDVDIPYVYGARINGKAAFYDRNTTAGTLPDKYLGYFGLATWS